VSASIYAVAAPQSERRPERPLVAWASESESEPWTHGEASVCTRLPQDSGFGVFGEILGGCRSGGAAGRTRGCVNDNVHYCGCVSGGGARLCRSRRIEKSVRLENDPPSSSSGLEFFCLLEQTGSRSVVHKPTFGPNCGARPLRLARPRM